VVALSVKTSVAARVPTAVGVKVTFTVQYPPLAESVPQLLFWLKSPGTVPPSTGCWTISETAAGFVSVTVWVADVVPTA